MSAKTTLLPKVGCYGFTAEPFHCDFQQRLFMGHLGNHLLNAADYHSDARGYGMTYLNTVHKTWVLSRLAIEMTEMPRMYEEFSVETWVDSVMRYFTGRNFAITSKQDGRVLGYGRSIWAMIDTLTRQPVDILAERDGIITDYLETEKECPIAPSSRVKLGKDVEAVRELVAQYHDVDINGHVNSVKYIEHVLDLWPLSWYREHTLKRFEIAYVAEGHQGDVLQFLREQVNQTTFFVKVIKADGTELSRSKVVFA